MSLNIISRKVMFKKSACSMVSRIPWLPLLVLTVGVLVCLGGCGVQQLTRGELEAPRVKFQSLAVGFPTGQGQPLECTLLVENPNPQDLRVLGYDYEFRLEGQKVIQGESRQEVTLPARGQTLVIVPILVNLQALPRFLPAILQNEKLRYQISGGVRLASLLGGFRVPFSFQGKMTPKEGREQLRLFLK
ncbi:MAG: LEA type 2 family protein [Deltaproteobacteria bacterium]|nr:LEA type 2 family protein [Deltaproteobacteria bacterium]MBI4796002.1 LEA type 2 family protein [Deltaproteobacteria bacterium]